MNIPFLVFVFCFAYFRSGPFEFLPSARTTGGHGELMSRITITESQDRAVETNENGI